MKVYYEVPDDVSYQGPIEVDCAEHDLDAVAKACAAHYHREHNELWALRMADICNNEMANFLNDGGSVDDEIPVML